ncbi:hypothetical protein TrVFT333_003084 [Trichoderma virens FT-333]|nr:hypothetical protein TrVFT333_003084 [Trichoderma virens FT-333]
MGQGFRPPQKPDAESHHLLAAGAVVPLPDLKRPLLNQLIRDETDNRGFSKFPVPPAVLRTEVDRKSFVMGSGNGGLRRDLGFLGFVFNVDDRWVAAAMKEAGAYVCCVK